ncbi:MAG: hypothetical protein ACREC6_00070 [Hyphomicrobiaceae bacterium]
MTRKQLMSALETYGLSLIAVSLAGRLLFGGYAVACAPAVDLLSWEGLQTMLVKPWTRACVEAVLQASWLAQAARWFVGVGLAIGLVMWIVSLVFKPRGKAA